MREPEAEQSILGTLEGLDGQRCTAARLAQAQSTRLSNGQKNISVKKMSFNSTTPYLKPFLQGEDLSRTPRVSPPASKGSSCALGPRAPPPREAAREAASAPGPLAPHCLGCLRGNSYPFPHHWIPVCARHCPRLEPRSPPPGPGLLRGTQVRQYPKVKT